MIKYLTRLYLRKASQRYIVEPNRLKCRNKLLHKIINTIPDIDKVTVRCTKQENALQNLDDCSIIETLHGVVVYKNQQYWHEFLMILDGSRYYLSCRSNTFTGDLAIKRTALTFSRLTYNLHRDYMAEDEL